MADRTTDKERIDLAAEASYEIGLLAEMLNTYIDEADAGGDISPPARGVLLRIGKLSDIIHGALIDNGELSESLDELRQELKGP